jgi:hypothetical protein
MQQGLSQAKECAENLKPYRYSTCKQFLSHGTFTNWVCSKSVRSYEFCQPDPVKDPRSPEDPSALPLKHACASC